MNTLPLTNEGVEILMSLSPYFNKSLKTQKQRNGWENTVKSDKSPTAAHKERPTGYRNKLSALYRIQNALKAKSVK
ncbi:unnamed protein product [Orchesella dallaii]|uniref:Uncharacterized protein n=1 Tax=Orchesella dallaii TaxID=48710 RepID=A0ABP1QIN1_9HEXA